MISCKIFVPLVYLTDKVLDIILPAGLHKHAAHPLTIQLTRADLLPLLLRQEVASNRAGLALDHRPDDRIEAFRTDSEVRYRGHDMPLSVQNREVTHAFIVERLLPYPVSQQLEIRRALRRNCPVERRLEQVDEVVEALAAWDMVHGTDTPGRLGRRVEGNEGAG